MFSALPDALAGVCSHEKRPKADFRAPRSRTSPPPSTFGALTPRPGRPGARTGRRPACPGPPLPTQPSVSPRLLSFMLHAPAPIPAFFLSPSPVGPRRHPRAQLSRAPRLSVTSFHLLEADPETAVGEKTLQNPSPNP